MSRLMEEWRSSENLIALSTNGTNVSSLIALDDYQWRSHCRGLYQRPVAA
jgi:hypothetical protein